jgi:hypothetical protein
MNMLETVELRGTADRQLAAFRALLVLILRAEGAGRVDTSLGLGTAVMELRDSVEATFAAMLANLQAVESNRARLVGRLMAGAVSQN